MDVQKNFRRKSHARTGIVITGLISAAASYCIFKDNKLPFDNLLVPYIMYGGATGFIASRLYIEQKKYFLKTLERTDRFPVYLNIKYNKKPNHRISRTERINYAKNIAAVCAAAATLIVGSYLALQFQSKLPQKTSKFVTSDLKKTPIIHQPNQ